MSLFGGLFGKEGGGPGDRDRGRDRNRDRDKLGDLEKFSFAGFQQLYERLRRFRESDLEKVEKGSQGTGGDAVVETVRQITEALIWGEQNDPRVFDFFCEKNILADFVRVLGLPKAPKKVRLQLLQTLSMLVLNIRCQTSVYYMLSNNHINRLFTTKLDFDDEEILAYYITLMKSLAMRLDSETIKFFFLQHPVPSFPLYIEATKFFDHRDQMVRTTVRTITLQVYRIDDPLMRRFVLRHAAESYFSQLSYHLRDLWFRLDAAACGAREEDDLKAVHRENELQQDLLIYLSDVFELGVEELNEVLADRLLNGAMLPMLLTGVMAVRGYAAAREVQTRVLMPFVALFLIRQVFDTFHCPSLLAPLASSLLQPAVPAALAYVLPQCPNPDASSPVASLQEDFLPNWLREHFLSCLQCSDDAVFLLSAAVVHGCLAHSEAILPSLLSQRAMEPTPKDGFPVGSAAVEFFVTGASDVQRDWQAEHAEGEQQLGSRGEADLEVYHILLQALYKYNEWHTETLRVFAQILLDIFLNPLILANFTVQTDLWRVVCEVTQAAATQVHDEVARCMELVDAGDWILDIFIDEWELYKAPQVMVAQFCGDAKRLLPASLWGASPRRRAGGNPMLARLPRAPDNDGSVRRAVRSLLLLRRLLKDLSRHPAHAWRLEPPSAPLPAAPPPAPKPPGSEPAGDGAQEATELDATAGDAPEAAEPSGEERQPASDSLEAAGPDEAEQPELDFPEPAAEPQDASERPEPSEEPQPRAGDEDDWGGERPPAPGGDDEAPAVPEEPSPAHPSHSPPPPPTTPASPWVRANEPNPLSLEAPGSFAEGMALDFVGFDRIVCGVASPRGKYTRYLLLHDFWFMLVQPDLASPGRATVRTLWPIWEVQALVDRGDPRTLQIFVSARCASARPGELALEGGGAAADTPVVLNFEDVGRCHAASEHLQRRRRCLRLEMMQRLASFAGSCRCEGYGP